MLVSWINLTAADVKHMLTIAEPAERLLNLKNEFSLCTMNER